ncbi:protein translocase component YidC [Virgisporangium aliadipatigenens]|uniref:Membrane protein insertase YidC n=1 Tax=Virgisporangium aliadipatigenens TaxID=741659 RepID=A0A8J4DRV7_9ACTN|nr:YidC/Oxa1 family membrane protein insertase [Virgisporangium aliadipatigenens]GIJ47173.1 protein translocase component YidC [Virgisporangium aliadipatigenens]
MFDAASGFALDVLTTLVNALAPIDGGVAVLAGVALLTALVRLALHPLARRQARAMQAQLAKAPALAEARKRAGDDPAKMQAELLDATKGMGGVFLPMLLQMPVFLALYPAFSRSTVDGRHNALLDADLLGVPLHAHGLAAGLPLLVLVAALVAIATVNVRRARRQAAAQRDAAQPQGVAPQPAPALVGILPYIAVVPALFMPLAAGMYLLTSTAWSAVEAPLLRRRYSAG